MFLRLVTFTFWPINGFPGLTVDDVYIKFGDPSCIGFWDTVEKQTDKCRRTPYPRDWLIDRVKVYVPAATAVGVGNHNLSLTN